MSPEELAAIRDRMEEARDEGAIYTMQQIAETLRLLAEVERLTKVAAAERELRKAGDAYVSGDVAQRAGEDAVVTAIAALVALGIDP